MKNLVNIQNELKVPKGNVNSFGNYCYRSAEDILEAVKPLLAKNDGILTLTDDIVEVGGKLFLKSRAVLWFSKEDWHEVCGFAQLAEHKGMSAEQATGTASSYARKYALNGLFLIDETAADADSQPPTLQQAKQPSSTITTTNTPTTWTKPAQSESGGLISEQQSKAIYAITKSKDVDEAKFIEDAFPGVIKSKLTSKQASEIIGRLNAL